MKEVGNIHWSNLNIGANNSTGFTGLPGGYRYSPNGGFYGIGEGGTWWLSTDDSVSWYRLYSDSELVGKWIRGGCCKPDGFGTRLIKD